VAPAEHLLDDYVAGADGMDLPSREHIGSFALGWAENYARDRGLDDLPSFARSVLGHVGAVSKDDDAHWHVYDVKATISLISMAAALSGRQLEPVRLWAPEPGWTQTLGDILIAYRLLPFRDEQDSLQADVFGQRVLEARRSRQSLMETASGVVVDADAFRVAPSGD
jgi:hypothetical protein